MSPLPRRFLFWIAVAVVVFVLDFASKRIVLASELAQHPVAIVPGFFNLVLVENPGAAFGLLADGGTAARIFLVAVAVAVAAALLWHLRFGNPANREALACALVLGGAAGNLADRLARNAVVDFLDFHIGNLHWPAFNLADSAITIGAILFAAEILFFRKGEKKL